MLVLFISFFNFLYSSIWFFTPIIIIPYHFVIFNHISELAISNWHSEFIITKYTSTKEICVWIYCPIIYITINLSFSKPFIQSFRVFLVIFSIIFLSVGFLTFLWLCFSRSVRFSRLRS